MGRKLPPRLSLTLILMLTVSGCYYLQAASGQFEVMRKREPIEEVVRDPRTPEDVRHRLQMLQEARQFAVTALGLPDNDSYRSYADLDRDYVVWNVFAAGEFSTEPERWCFPVAGCVAYRGYFSRDAAEREAARLARRGFDVHIAGVAAYSTLGRFADPVLNTMLGWSDLHLLQTLFHELAHQKLYVKDDTEFNESFATVVARVGVRRWLTERAQWEALSELERRVAWQADWLAEINRFLGELQDLYDRGLPPQRMREEKSQLFAALARSSFAPADPPDNNAALIPMMAYHGLVAELLDLLAACDGDLACFYARSAALADMDSEARRERLASYR